MPELPESSIEEQEIPVNDSELGDALAIISAQEGRRHRIRMISEAPESPQRSRSPLNLLRSD